MLYTKYIYLVQKLGNHTFAGLKAGESYENICTGFSEVFLELNSLIENPAGGTQYNLEFLLGGDYHNNYMKLTCMIDSFYYL